MFTLLPAWECKYEIPVPVNSWIINQPKLSANMYYLSGKLSGSGKVEFIELRVISETQPENRLTTLIQRGLLKEAEVILYFVILLKMRIKIQNL